MFSHKTVHYLNEQLQKTAFESYNLNKSGAAKIFIGEIFKSQMDLVE